MIKDAYFAGGCFWCLTPGYAESPGVLEVKAGYCGGDIANPSYELVKSQQTNHRETIRVTYDDELVSYLELLNIFLDSVDVYDEGGQYIDRGHSYTLAIYYKEDSELNIINNRLSEYKEKIYVSVEPYTIFYLAEEYHQNYYLKHPKEFEEELIKSGRKQ